MEKVSECRGISKTTKTYKSNISLLKPYCCYAYCEVLDTPLCTHAENDGFVNGSGTLCDGTDTRENNLLWFDCSLLHVLLLFLWFSTVSL